MTKQDILDYFSDINYAYNNCNKHDDLSRMLDELLETQPRWISCSERLPDNTDPVSITWVNHDPESYYADIKDNPFAATGHYCNGRWWWYSVTCQDYLNEYGRCDFDAMNDAIEVIAWMPLPEPAREIKHTCSECVIKDTDACARGNAEADEVACEDFVGGESDAK